ncbi:MAG: sugar ABC transporter permease [Microbacteriaceae bacterium]|nr:sugar ABC transporter permease [Microbacteriaceae bacterium]
MSQQRRGYGWFLYPGFIVLVVFFGTMFVWNIGISFLKWPGYGPAKWIGFDNYVHLFDKPEFWESWTHALFYVVPFALLPTVVGLALASIVYEAFRGTISRALVPFARAGFFLPQIVPISVAGLIWLWMLDSMSVTWLTEPLPALLVLSVFMFWLQMGFAFVVYLAGFSRLEPALLEAASLDGAGWWHRLRYISGPAVWPETSVILVFLGVGALKVFAPVYYLTGGGPYDSTISPATYAVTSFFGGRSVGFASAVSTVLALVILIAVVTVLTVSTRLRRSNR